MLQAPFICKKKILNTLVTCTFTLNQYAAVYKRENIFVNIFVSSINKQCLRHDCLESDVIVRALQQFRIQDHIPMSFIETLKITEQRPITGVTSSVRKKKKKMKGREGKKVENDTQKEPQTQRQEFVQSWLLQFASMN